MKPSERNVPRVLWTLVALAALYGIITTVVYELDGTFGTGWFATSLVVYGSLLVAAVAMALLDGGRGALDPTERAVDQPATLKQRGFELVSQETLYETPTGRVVRPRFRLGGDSNEMVFAISHDEALAISEVEDRLDDAGLSVQAPALEPEVDRAIQERAQREQVPTGAGPGGQHGNDPPADDQHPTEV